MDTPLKISYTVWRKHGDTLYCRVRQKGAKPLDVNLHTTEQSKAEAFVRLRKQELELYNSYILAGEQVPDDVAAKLLRRGSPAVVKQNPSKAVLTRTAMEAWEVDLRRRGLRERSIESYMKSIRLTVPPEDPISSYTKKSLAEYLRKHDGLKQSTRKMYSVSLREFCKFCIYEYDLDRRLIDNWPMVKVEEKEMPAWTLQQMYHIIENVKCINKECEEQFKVYLWIMATAGSRQGETGSLLWTDFVDGVLTFRAEVTKANKTRKVPLDRRVAEMILRLPRKSRLMFPDIPPSQPGRYAILAKAIRRAKAPHGGLHTFRHSCARIMYAKCQDIKSVASMLGHSPEVSLKHYTLARQSDELKTIVNSTFGDEVLIPDRMDELIKAGLV